MNMIAIICCAAFAAVTCIQNVMLRKELRNVSGCLEDVLCSLEIGNSDRQSDFSDFFGDNDDYDEEEYDTPRAGGQKGKKPADFMTIAYIAALSAIILIALLIPVPTWKGDCSLQTNEGAEAFSVSAESRIAAVKESAPENMTSDESAQELLAGEPENKPEETGKSTKLQSEDVSVTTSRSSKSSDRTASSSKTTATRKKSTSTSTTTKRKTTTSTTASARTETSVTGNNTTVTSASSSGTVTTTTMNDEPDPPIDDDSATSGTTVQTASTAATTASTTEPTIPARLELMQEIIAYASSRGMEFCPALAEEFKEPRDIVYERYHDNYTEAIKDCIDYYANCGGSYELIYFNFSSAGDECYLYFG